MEKDITIFEVIFWAVIAVLMIDVIGFIVWGLSGQVPGDSFFFGTITQHILQALFF